MPTVVENPFFNYSLRLNDVDFIFNVLFSNPPAPLLQATSSVFWLRYVLMVLMLYRTNSYGSCGPTKNLLVMKLGFLKWHNLSLLYIWRAIQEAIVKKSISFQVGLRFYNGPTECSETCSKHCPASLYRLAQGEQIKSSIIKKAAWVFAPTGIALTHRRSSHRCGYGGNRLQYPELLCSYFRDTFRVHAGIARR